MARASTRSSPNPDDPQDEELNARPDDGSDGSDTATVADTGAAGAAGADVVGAAGAAPNGGAAATSGSDPLDPAVLGAELARARRDAASYREQRNAARAELESAQSEVARLTAEIAGARRFELTAAAEQAGMIRPEDLEFMVDQSGVDRLLAEAEPTRRSELINEFIERVRQDRPHWFDPNAAVRAAHGMTSMAVGALGIPRGPGAAPLPKVTPGFSGAVERAMSRRPAA